MQEIESRSRKLTDGEWGADAAANAEQRNAREWCPRISADILGRVSAEESRPVDHGPADLLDPPHPDPRRDDRRRQLWGEFGRQGSRLRRRRHRGAVHPGGADAAVPQEVPPMVV